jgi:hypothetical protein
MTERSNDFLLAALTRAVKFSSGAGYEHGSSLLGMRTPRLVPGIHDPDAIRVGCRPQDRM